MLIEPEQYNTFGEIIKIEKPKIYERTISMAAQHRIHETKDLFDGGCSYCQLEAKKAQKRWEEENA